MVVESNHETIIAQGEFKVSKNPHELLKAVRVASSIVVVAYDPSCFIGAMIHMAMPDSKVTANGAESMFKYVDVGLPHFITELNQNGVSRTHVQIKIVGGSQLFNFGGGGGNLLNIGTRNAIATRTILNREGLPVEKTETGGNKPRTVTLDVALGRVQVHYPGESPRYI